MKSAKHELARFHNLLESHNQIFKTVHSFDISTSKMKIDIRLNDMYTCNSKYVTFLIFLKGINEM